MIHIIFYLNVCVCLLFECSEFPNMYMAYCAYRNSMSSLPKRDLIKIEVNYTHTYARAHAHSMEFLDMEFYFPPSSLGSQNLIWNFRHLCSWYFFFFFFFSSSDSNILHFFMVRPYNIYII